MVEQKPVWLTTAEAAEWLGVQGATVLRAINDGRLKAFRPGVRNIRIRLEDLKEYLESSAVEPGSLSPEEPGPSAGVD